MVSARAACRDGTDTLRTLKRAPLDLQQIFRNLRTTPEQHRKLYIFSNISKRCGTVPDIITAQTCYYNFLRTSYFQNLKLHINISGTTNGYQIRRPCSAWILNVLEGGGLPLPYPSPPWAWFRTCSKHNIKQTNDRHLCFLCWRRGGPGKRGNQGSFCFPLVFYNILMLPPLLGNWWEAPSPPPGQLLGSSHPSSWAAAEKLPPLLLGSCWEAPSPPPGQLLGSSLSPSWRYWRSSVGSSRPK